jgi:hypothetical protein
MSAPRSRAGTYKEKAERLYRAYGVLRKRYLNTPPENSDMLSVLIITIFYHLVHVAESYLQEAGYKPSANHDARFASLLAVGGTRIFAPYKAVHDVAWRARYIPDFRPQPHDIELIEAQVKRFCDATSQVKGEGTPH